MLVTYLSILNAAAGILMLLSPNYKHIQLPWIMIFLVIAGIADMFDGTIARKMELTEHRKQFGIQIDSLADTISFVVFPALIMLRVSSNGGMSFIIACAYLFAGINRLAWFNTKTEENIGFYQGLPVTFAALIFPVVYIICYLFRLPHLDIILQVVTAITGILFVTNFKLNKPGKKMKVIISAIAIAAVLILFAIA
jgi:CDP-diacylglycerol--serine O-phosphatidyltransferase